MQVDFETYSDKNIVCRNSLTVLQYFLVIKQ